MFEPVLATCRSCAEPIFWAKTRATGAVMPVDYHPTIRGNIVVQDPARSPPLVAVVSDLDPQPLPLFAAEPRYTSHFVTCDDAARWRRQRKRKG